MAHMQTDAPPFHSVNPLSPPGSDIIDPKSTMASLYHPNFSCPSPRAEWDLGGATLARSVSADAATQSYSRLFNGQSPFAQDWKHERSDVTALRRKAERLYHDQQRVIEDLNEIWFRERVEVSRWICGLQERIRWLEGENVALRNMTPWGFQLNHPHQGAVFPTESRSSPAARPAGRTTAESEAASSLPPGLDGASRRPHFAVPGASARTSPNGAPSAGRYTPLSPRTEPQQSANTDFLQSSSLNPDGHVPIIDVHEIDPKLEGIPIKATALQKTTFEPQPFHSSCDSLGFPPSSAHDHTEKHKSDNNVGERLRADRRRFGLAPLSISRDQDQTKEVLAADESRRLTMHAGHTPNHSLSLFSTMTAPGGDSTAPCSQETTPITCENSKTAERRHAGNGASNRRNSHVHWLTEQLKHRVDQRNGDFLEPVDDVPLKGPLMIRNIPAHDEKFWEQVDRRLDPISRGQNALPKVLQSQEPILAPALVFGGQHAPGQEGDTQENDPQTKSEDDEGDEEAGSSVEPDVPLKFKSTSNFGAPFGSA